MPYKTRDPLAQRIAREARIHALGAVRDAHYYEYRAAYIARRLELEKTYGYTSKGHAKPESVAQRREALDRLEDYIGTNPDSTLKEIAEGMGVKWRWVVKWIRVLDEQGKLKYRWVVVNRAQAKRWSLA